MKERKKFKKGELSTERLCIKCNEYWPLDDEFWYVLTDGRMHSYCKACCNQRRYELRKGAKMNEKGFTLIEIIAVLILLGVLAAFAVPRYIDLESNAKQRAIDNAIGELNGRESLTWADEKISNTGFSDDTVLFGKVDYSLGDDFSWQGGVPSQSGGTIVFKGVSESLTRQGATQQQPAIWRR